MKATRVTSLVVLLCFLTGVFGISCGVSNQKDSPTDSDLNAKASAGQLTFEGYKQVNEGVEGISGASDALATGYNDPKVISAQLQVISESTLVIADGMTSFLKAFLRSPKAMKQHLPELSKLSAKLIKKIKAANTKFAGKNEVLGKFNSVITIGDGLAKLVEAHNSNGDMLMCFDRLTDATIMILEGVTALSGENPGLATVATLIELASGIKNGDIKIPGNDKYIGDPLKAKASTAAQLADIDAMGETYVSWLSTACMRKKPINAKVKENILAAVTEVRKLKATDDSWGRYAPISGIACIFDARQKQKVKTPLDVQPGSGACGTGRPFETLQHYAQMLDVYGYPCPGLPK